MLGNQPNQTTLEALEETQLSKWFSETRQK
jgi:hypothetical protein